MTLCGYVL